MSVRVVEYEEGLFRTPEADYLLSKLLDADVSLSLYRRDNTYGKVEITGPLRTFLVELLTRCRIGMEIEFEMRPAAAHTDAPSVPTGGE